MELAEVMALGRKEQGSLANVERRLSKWWARSSGTKVRNEFGEVGKGQICLGLSGCLRIWSNCLISKPQLGLNIPQPEQLWQGAGGRQTLGWEARRKSGSSLCLSGRWVPEVYLQSYHICIRTHHRWINTPGILESFAWGALMKEIILGVIV